MQRWMVAFWLMALAACGNSGSSGSASVTGTFLGTSFHPADATSWQVSSGSQVETVVAISDFSGACDAATGNLVHANSNVLSFLFSSTGALTAGESLDVTASTGTTAEAQFAEFDATCNSSQGESASSGTIKITKADSAEVDGSFDLTFNSDHVTGTFSAPNCSGVPAASGTTMPTCK